MFKQKLHEYCQSKSWLLPEYRAKREGPHHSPRFKGAILVNGVTFTSPLFAHSVKEAHNLAAKSALNHFIGSSNLGMTATKVPASSSIQISETQATSLDIGNMFKNQLQIYAQKKNLPLPVYSTERRGHFHASLFKSRVTVEGKIYESEESFHTLKEAETAAAKIAIASVIPKGTQEDNTSIYKNLLQEYLLKGTPCHPKYTTVRTGPPHMPTFVSTVEILGETFNGEPAKTKKQAELNAAKVAFVALKERGFKEDDKLDSVRATTHVAKTPPSLPAKIHDVRTPNLSKNVSWHAKLMSEVSGANLIGTKDPISAPPPNHFTRMPGSTTRFGSVQNLKATSSVPKPICYPAASRPTPTSCINSWSAGGSSLDEMRRKKKKITIHPQSSNKRPAYMKPGNNERPGYMKPGTNARPGPPGFMKPGTNARPGPPGFMKPGTNARPGPPGYTKPGTNQRPGYMKPGNNQRPGYIKPEPSS